MPSSISLRTTGLRNVPDALLLDFGGVIFETEKDAEGKCRLAEAFRARLERAELDVSVDTLLRSLTAGLAALKYWKHAQSRRLAPRELEPREIVGDFLVADLPAAARALLVAEAPDVLLEVTTVLATHRVRPGIRELLDLADEHGIPVGIVSNAHSGRSHRRVLEQHGLEGRFAVQCYSDEVGIRKPNPEIIHLAAEAVGTTANRCWYVGDTQDRDVVAGRRAGVGAVVLTRSHHTDSPPFSVDGEADAVYPTPEGLVVALIEALADRANDTPEPAGQDEPVAEAEVTRGRAALLIDHGGVISSSREDAAMLEAFAEWLATLLQGPEAGPDALQVVQLIAQARDTHREWKRAGLEAFASGEAHLAEADPRIFWRDWFGASLSTRQRAVLHAETHDIMARYGRAKSVRTLRPGVRELLEQCRDARMPVIVVSNTVSGVAVRAECAQHGLTDLIGAYVCSDEVGVRKPDATIVHEALLIAAADPASTWFLGDKPQNDAVGARAAGIAHRVLVRGGSTDDAALDAALADGLATHVVADPGELVVFIGAQVANAKQLDSPSVLVH